MTVGAAAQTETVALDEVQRRVLWLSMNMVHHANRVRPNTSGVKVGGHQASSASIVTIMTELFFHFMGPRDRLSVKPHGSPVLHAIHYLLGNLDRSYLTELRAYHGLQAYPSRTKDPDPVDFSTGSVGIGSIAPNFAALVEHFVKSRFGQSSAKSGRFISLLGDAELDEGSVWETVSEPALSGLRNIVWIVDLNRQSLDRIVPGLRVRQLEDMFKANQWTVIEAKYGKRLEKAFEAVPRLRHVLDAMSNEEYQLLLRSDRGRVADALGHPKLETSDSDLRELIADLGGHDFEVLARALCEADKAPGPAVIFAYTIKGWGLTVAGDPLNHSALLNDEDLGRLRKSLGVPDDDEWAALDPNSDGGRLTRRRAQELTAVPRSRALPLEVPQDLGGGYRGKLSTQQVFGQILTSLLRVAPETADRIVTASPDVATSTNLGGWINRVGVWDASPNPDIFSELGPRLISWNRHPKGQHIELGISETNLLMLLGQLGLAAELTGQPLLPIGTVYDPFIARALDAYVYSVYAGSRFILVGTPSGVTLAPEGGAHQSVLTPAIGIAMPRVTYWEPCFAQELEWVLLAALGVLHRGEQSESSYLRLSTLPIDQDTFAMAAPSREAVLSGAYTIFNSTVGSQAPATNSVDIWATGVMVPTAVRAAQELVGDRIDARVINCVSPGLVYRRWQQAVHGAMEHLHALPVRGGSPVVTVIDGHSSALGWIGSMLGVRSVPLGVTDFGQSGLPHELHKHFQIDEDSIAYAAYVALQD